MYSMILMVPREAPNARSFTTCVIALRYHCRKKVHYASSTKGRYLSWPVQNTTAHPALYLISAPGTESTAKSMAITHFHLISNPPIIAKLRAELRNVPENASCTELEQLPYLSACIAEGNRLSFGVTARLCRIAPDETLHYKSYTIPPGTPVSMTTLCVHTDERIFPDPWSFNPDRWLGPEGLKRRKYQMAFNKGARGCIGIHLAHAELFMVIAAVARYELRLFETDGSDVEFCHDYHVAYPRLDSKGVRVVVGKKVAMA